MKKEDVWFNSGNVKLSGTLYVNESDEDKSIVILLPDLGGKKEWFKRKAIDICNAGNHVFAFDFRGQGESEGTSDEKVFEDIHFAIKYVKEVFKEEKLPIILGGECMGALVSIHEACREDDVIGVFAMSLVDDHEVDDEMWGLVKQCMREHHSGHSVRLNDESYYKGFKKLNLRQSLDKLGMKPILVIHYEDDEISSLSSIYKTVMESRCNKTFIVLNGGQHVAPFVYNDFNQLIVWWISKTKQRWYLDV